MKKNEKENNFGIGDIVRYKYDNGTDIYFGIITKLGDSPNGPSANVLWLNLHEQIPTDPGINYCFIDLVKVT
jgi:hypothetical protein